MLLLAITTGNAQQRISIWDGTTVKAPKVTLEVYTPEHAKGPASQPDAAVPAVIVCPGGSYCWHDYEVEGTDVARWLAQNGIAAFVLRYRVQGVFDYVMHTRLLHRGHKHPQMLQDAQRALQYVREHAQQFGIDPHKVGAMGFSAGGHLVMSLACYHHTDFLKPLGITVTTSLRPDFVAPIYPVVTLSKPVAHKRSRRALLGETRKYRTAMRDSLSLEQHVPTDCPPVFLLNCKDDPVVKYQNSVLLDSALTHHAIPHLYLQYRTGGHGFGASATKGTAECRQWKSAFLRWLKDTLHYDIGSGNSGLSGLSGNRNVSH